MNTFEITITIQHHYDKNDGHKVKALVERTLEQCGWSIVKPKNKKPKVTNKAIHRMSQMNAPFPGHKSMVTMEEAWRVHSESLDMMIQKGINNYYPEKYVRS